MPRKPDTEGAKASYGEPPDRSNTPQQGCPVSGSMNGRPPCRAVPHSPKPRDYWSYAVSSGLLITPPRANGFLDDVPNHAISLTSSNSFIYELDDLRR